MLNPFPDLLTYVLFAPLIIRVFLGLYYLSFGYSSIKQLYSKNKPVENKEGNTETSNNNDLNEKGDLQHSLMDHLSGWLALLGGVLVFMGIFTQIGAIALMAVSFYLVFKTEENRLAHLLLFAMASTLLFTSAGFYSFDLPL